VLLYNDMVEGSITFQEIIDQGLCLVRKDIWEWGLKEYHDVMETNDKLNQEIEILKERIRELENAK